MDTSIESHPLIVRLRRELMPQLNQAALALNESLAPALVSVFSGTVGSLTSFQGFHFGIECVFPDVAKDEPDNVAFMVSACHLDREPRLTADVCWGSPGHIEASLDAGSSEDWPLASEGRIEEVLSEVPRLLLVFAAAAKRGHP